jgi:SpoIID/LytB domain protein
METLKAQAIAGRSFAIARVDLFGQHREVCNCGVYSTTRDQAYVGSDKERGPSGDRWVEAVDSTANVAVLSAGKAIPAYYGAADGGHTEHIENVWGGSPVSYLRGVCDPGDYSPANPYTSWTVTMSGAVVGDKLAAATGQDVGDVLSFTNAARGVSGRIISIQANGTSGSMNVPGGTFESALGLRERVVWINENRIITGWIRNEYDWTNCKPGLPASPGFYVSGGRYQSFQDGRIYANFAREHAYWVHGAVLTKYQGLGAHAGFLKLPVSRQFALANGLDFRQDFQGGRIYWSSRTGAHELHGRVLSYWVSLRGNESSLGMPVTDVTTTATTQSATFEFGTVTCNLSTGACTDTGMTPQFA